MGVRIDALNAAASAADNHEIPAIKDGSTVKLTVEQLSDKVQADISGVFAPLVSPSFTGNPTVPTQPVGNNSTRSASTAFVKGEIDTAVAINPLPGKSTPVDADQFRIADSEVSNAAKKLTFANLKAWILSFLPFAKEYVSGEQPITASGLLTLAHGLGEMPKLVQTRLRCKVADAGYSVGDEVLAFGLADDNSDQINGGQLYADASNIYVRFSSAPTLYVIIHKATGARGAIALANWRLIIGAWA